MTDPITPGQVASEKLAQLPDLVIVAFNELIARAWDGQRAMVYQEDAVEAILSTGVARTREEIFELHLLDVEPVYQAAGWSVTYDKPGFNETYQPYFAFTRQG